MVYTPAGDDKDRGRRKAAFLIQTEDELLGIGK